MNIKDYPRRSALTQAGEHVARPAQANDLGDVHLTFGARSQRSPTGPCNQTGVRSISFGKGYKEPDRSTFSKKGHDKWIVSAPSSSPLASSPRPRPTSTTDSPRFDPHREYASLIARLHGKQVVGSRPSPELFEDESRMDIVHDLASSHDGNIDSPGCNHLRSFALGSSLEMHSIKITRL